MPAIRQEHRIIVEGMDGSGKTTLIDRLRYDFDELVLVRNPLDDKQDFTTWWPQEMDREPSKIIPIHDRFFYSEIVYGPVLRQRINAPQALVDNVAIFLRLTALLIYARPNSSIILDAVKNNEHMDGVKEKGQELLELYDNVMMVELQWYKDRFIRYDWNNPESYPQVEDTVRTYLNGKLP